MVSPLHQDTEALLYGFQSIAETIDVNYSDVIPGLIGLIPRISINNVQLADTVMFTIGENCFIGRWKESQHVSPPTPFTHSSLFFRHQVLWPSGWRTTR